MWYQKSYLLTSCKPDPKAFPTFHSLTCIYIDTDHDLPSKSLLFISEFQPLDSFFCLTYWLLFLHPTVYHKIQSSVFYFFPAMLLPSEKSGPSLDLWQFCANLYLQSQLSGCSPNAHNLLAWGGLITTWTSQNLKPKSSPSSSNHSPMSPFYLLWSFNHQVWSFILFFHRFLILFSLHYLTFGLLSICTIGPIFQTSHPYYCNCFLICFPSHGPTS